MPELASLVLTAAGTVAGGLLKKAAQKHVESFFGDAIKKVAKLGQKKPMVEAAEQAAAAFAELILANVKVLADYEGAEPDFKACGQAVARLIDDRAVGHELLKPLVEPQDDTRPDVAVLRDAWHRLGGPGVPAGFSWPAIVERYRRRLTGQRIVTPELRAQLDTENLAAIRAAVEAQAGVQPQGNEARYAERMREKYRVLDLSAMRPPTADDTGLIQLRQAFVPPSVREDPPSVELPVAGRAGGLPGIQPSSDRLRIRLP